MTSSDATRSRAAIPIGRRTRIGRGGVMFVAITILFAVGAINGQNNLLYLLFGIGIASLLVGGLVGGTAMMGLRVERIRIGQARAGEPVRVRYRVENRGRWLSVYGLVIEEHRPETGAPGAVDGEDASVRVVLDRPVRAFVARAPARGVVTADGTATALTRGHLALGTFSVITSFPFGLLEKRLVFSQAREATVFPAPVELRRDLGTPRSSWLERSDEANDRVGPGTEFLTTREYKPGDSPRSISWRLSARTGQPVVRVTADEAGSTVRVHLSAGRARDGGGVALASDDPAVHLADHRAAALAAALIDRLVRAGRGVELVTHDAALVVGADAESRSRAMRLLSEWRPSPGPVARPEHGEPDFVVGSRAVAPPGAVALDPAEPGAWLHAGARLPDVLDEAWVRDRGAPAGGAGWHRFLPTIGLRPRDAAGDAGGDGAGVGPGAGADAGVRAEPAA